MEMVKSRRQSNWNTKKSILYQVPTKLHQRSTPCTVNENPDSKSTWLCAQVLLKWNRVFTFCFPHLLFFILLLLLLVCFFYFGFYVVILWCFLMIPKPQKRCTQLCLYEKIFYEEKVHLLFMFIAPFCTSFPLYKI